jgi:hypothetical protein
VGHQGVSVGDGASTATASTICTSLSRPACPTGCFGTAATARSRTSPIRCGVGVLDDTSQSLFADVDNDGDQDLIVLDAPGPLLFINDGKGALHRGPRRLQFAQPLQGVLTSMAMADYDRDGFLDLYLCVYSYFFGAGEDKAGHAGAVLRRAQRTAGRALRNDGHGRFVDVTREAGSRRRQRSISFRGRLGRLRRRRLARSPGRERLRPKNLYRNLGRCGRPVTFRRMSPRRRASLDHGAGMSAAFLDYDNDGRLDIYTGNMWSAPGQRVTPRRPSCPTRRRRCARSISGMPAATRCSESRQRHASRTDARGARRDGPLGVVVGRVRLRQRRLGRSLHRQRHADARRDAAAGGRSRAERRRKLLLAPGRRASPLTRVPGTPYDDAWRAINQLLVHGSIASRQRNVFLRNDGHGGFDEISGALGPRPRSGRPVVRGARRRRRRRSGSRGDGGAAGAAAADLPQRFASRRMRRRSPSA